jgi:uncharacterized protein
MSIRHEPESNRFVTSVDSMESFVEYKLTTGGPKKLVDFYHTYTNPKLQGRGLAKKVVSEACDWAMGKGYQIKGSCSYVAKFLSENPKYTQNSSPSKL